MRAALVGLVILSLVGLAAAFASSGSTCAADTACWTDADCTTGRCCKGRCVATPTSSQYLGDLCRTPNVCEVPGCAYGTCVTPNMGTYGGVSSGQRCERAGFSIGCPCANSNECATGISYCDMTQVIPVCVEINLPNGVACVNNTQCVSGLCTAGVCTGRADGAACPDATYCLATSYCVGGICGAQKTNGAVCSSSADCALGLSCNGTCITNFAGIAGQRCTEGANCASKVCLLTPASSGVTVCAPDAMRTVGAGAACPNGDIDCKVGLSCIGSGTLGVCVGINGAQCTTSTDCGFLASSATNDFSPAVYSTQTCDTCKGRCSVATVSANPKCDSSSDDIVNTLQKFFPSFQATSNFNAFLNKRVDLYSDAIKAAFVNYFCCYYEANSAFTVAANAFQYLPFTINCKTKAITTLTAAQVKEYGMCTATQTTDIGKMLIGVNLRATTSPAAAFAPAAAAIAAFAALALALVL